MQPAPSNLIVILLVVVALGALAACGGESAAESEPEPSAPRPLRRAPPFALESLEGESLTLAGLEKDHRAILMNFWASWCEPCKVEVPDLIALHEEYRDRGFTVLGVTVSDLPRDSRAFVKEMRMTYPSVIGTPAMLEDYRLSPWLPTTLLVVDGQVVGEWVGPRVRADFEYPIKAALGLAPPLDVMLKDASGAGE